jgi:hypothetical protein
MHMKNLKTITAVLVSLLAPAVAASLHATPTPTPPPVPTGVFYLPSSGTIDVNALNNANVDGVVIGARWSDLERDFDDDWHFDSLDALLDVVEQQPNPKPIRLAIATGGPEASPAPTACPGYTPSAGNKPHWVIQAIQNDTTYQAEKFFTYWEDSDHTTTATIPIFWEPVLLAEHAELVQAVADYIRTDHAQSYGLIKVVFVPYANAETNDWNLGATSNMPDDLPCDTRTPEERWRATFIPGNLRYANMEQALKYAGNQTYIAYHAAFPDKLLTTSIGRLENTNLNPGGDGNYGRNISETVVLTAKNKWPNFIIAQKNNLNGGGLLPGGGGVPPASPTPPPEAHQWYDLYRLHTVFAIPTAAQMVWHAWDDCGQNPPDHYYAQRMNAGTNSPCKDSTQMLYYAVKVGITYATQWQEIYEKDILNLDGMNMDPHIPPVPPPLGPIPRNVIRYAHENL